VPAYVALLRAVNVAGRNFLSMTALTEVLTALGMRHPRTILQSGNVVFESRVRSCDILELQLQEAVKDALGLDIDIMVRSGEQWRGLVDVNPFPAEAARDPARLLMMCLKAVPQPTTLSALRAQITGPERLAAHSRELYLVYPDGIGKSRFTTAVIERGLGTRATGRNWNTVLKILNAVVAPSPRTPTGVLHPRH
jgi:uncharacterized protein (DUF1697 family)